MVHNEPGIGMNPNFKAEPGRLYRHRVTKNALGEGAVLVKDTPLRGKEPAHPLGRLKVTDEQLDRAREEMYRDIMSPDIKPAADLLKPHFAKWLTESGDLSTLRDEDVQSLKQALDLLIDRTKTRGYVGATDLGNADKVREDAKQLASTTSTHVSLINPITDGQREDMYSLSVIFDRDGRLKYGDKETGIVAKMVIGAVTAERQDELEMDGASTNDYFPAITENYDELLYLSEKISALAQNSTAKHEFAKPEILRSFLRGHATRQNYPVSRIVPGGRQWTEAPLDIDCLLNRFTHAKLLTGISASFKEATGKDTPIHHFDENEGVRDVFMARWRRTSADIDAKTLAGFDEKYRWFFDSASELIKANPDKGFEVYDRIRNEHKQRFNIRPYFGEPTVPPLSK